MSNARITLVNPNCLVKVTEAIARATAPFQGLPLDFRFLTSTGGPAGIQTQAEADASIAPMAQLFRQEAAATDAFIVACFSDPGLHGLRDLVPVPVLGIGECSVLTAMSMATRIGVIAIASAAVARHLRYFRAMGVADRICGELALDMKVSDLADPESAFERMTAVGRTLRDDHGADVLIMGCAGMADLRDRLEEACGLPVVEPTQAAVAMAAGRLFSRA
ncbi:aspartate/glutamate racemase family protein [Achromobacter xylosoxidans]|uniref:Asp/Glu racemase n=1 Tax=Alcaligenes xylosoxydans xylosoxydans TaxID=85698 RepID=A0A424WFT7_ALCXX|nr:aspartate/glutamate racemase family protein [Achromobacter xylosoxidans]MBC9905809.1 aspartate/glutamate racemase family protein [Achromobacter xylosoxidans]MBD0869306.1 aspartate/glutamate racemase family protein [Achromobacter xylosoxidans]QNP86193.1 aspartate/glutamate racemase family protein [Achromobacter xylosoxidans]RPJ92101.1 Asp/Glu racemase [Achromobacter xylosoxidans]